MPANPPSINSLADTKRSSLPPPIYFDSIDPTAVIQLCVALSPDTGTLVFEYHDDDQTLAASSVANTAKDSVTGHNHNW